MARTYKIALLVVALFILFADTTELVHRRRFGHVFPFSLHADIVVINADYGIDGITQVYESKPTNYGITRAKVQVCDFVDDASAHGTVIGYSVEEGTWASWLYDLRVATRLDSAFQLSEQCLVCLLLDVTGLCGGHEFTGSLSARGRLSSFRIGAILGAARGPLGFVATRSSGRQ
jgi:hypothetical protein